MAAAFSYREAGVLLVLLILPASAVTTMILASRSPSPLPASSGSGSGVGEPIEGCLNITIRVLDESLRPRLEFKPGAWVVLNVTLYLPEVIYPPYYYYYYYGAQPIETTPQRYVAVVEVRLGDQTLFYSGFRGIINPGQYVNFYAWYKLPYTAEEGVYKVIVTVYNEWPPIAGPETVVIGYPVEAEFVVTNR